MLNSYSPVQGDSYVPPQKESPEGGAAEPGEIGKENICQEGTSLEEFERLKKTHGYGAAWYDEKGNLRMEFIPPVE